jgi:hypothetical protein
MKPYPMVHRICRASASRRAEILATPNLDGTRLEMTRAGNPASSHEAERIRSALQEQLTPQ